jgi:hypothetical protein
LTRASLLLVTAGAFLALGAQPAAATAECRGLQVCVRVAGPWVAVPTVRAAPRPSVDYQLSCPRGFIVGGLDAELSDRAIDVSFRGKVGSPVGPGVTTSRAAVFAATYVGVSPRTPTFRPHLGCLPTSGGGSGPVPFRLSGGAAFPPGEPTVRRVRNIALRSARVRAVASCAPGERLISGWHAIGFYTSSAPSPAVVQSVTSTRRLRGGRVEVLVRSGPAVRTIRSVVQVGAVCGGAP